MAADIVPPRPTPILHTVLDRRQTLTLGLSAAVAILGSEAAVAQSQSFPQAVLAALPEGQPFDAARVADMARTLARRAFVPPASDLPDPLGSLTYEQYVGIRALGTALVWNGEGRAFSLEPLHRGFLFTNPVQLFVVEDGAVRRLAYERGKFDFGKLQVPAGTPGGPDFGFSGFRVFFGGAGEAAQEIAIFQGATFFRAIARGQNFGAQARALMLRPAEAKGEEVPIFRAFWIERPSAGSGALVIHALLDSESVAGAVRFTLRPGEMTIIDVETTLFPRVALEHVGLGGMTATYLFGPNDQRGIDDARAAVYEAKGLQMLNGQGEWIWRPLSNPETLQISAFVDTDPRGIGLLQRDRDYATFQDDDQRFERRPSLWIEPFGDWGPGTVQLIEVPSDSEVNDNVIAYWRPKTPYPQGGEVTFAYRQFWCWKPPERPPLATVANTRVGRGSNNRRRRFFVDFVGDSLADAGTTVEAKPALTTAPGAVHNVRVWPYPERKTLRVAFELDPGNETSCELRLVLEAAGKPLSETWLYRWTP
ncbi:glucan biosynthesis protein [Chelatococcus sp. SYSU_G07232]|uniref:Glucan biosynthesis protein n=1 Tax=Chelatococcus albus TaxID=3047466 RepID=A0ABT7ABZ6_9HYPH|nr:glucan biosynthesis protein [Chelatococcus sp. SYSU_G07232]MDJ1156886.1 glucan biosynthesis protein [Chelatococcus sp. SYSU_G07232]